MYGEDGSWPVTRLGITGGLSDCWKREMRESEFVREGDPRFQKSLKAAAAPQ